METNEALMKNLLMSYFEKYDINWRIWMGIGKQKSMSHFKKYKMIPSNIIQWRNHVHMLIDPFPYGSPHMIWKPTSSKKPQWHTTYAYEKTSFAFLKTWYWKYSFENNSLDCIASSTRGRRSGENGELFGMLWMMDCNLGLCHVQPKK
jgi:hypothetical protein